MLYWLKKVLLKKEALFPFIFLIFFIWRQGPVFLNSFQVKGMVIAPRSYEVIAPENGVSSINFPPSNEKVIAIFWATWCGPCKVEMERLKKSMEKNLSLKGKIYAFDPFESPAEIKSFLLKNSYPFIFVNAPYISKLLNVKATPTTVFIKDNVVTLMETGMSIVGIWRAELFLKTH